MIYYTHALLGLTTYTAMNKEQMPARTKAALLTAAVVGSVIPDIDVVVRYTEIGQLYYQMWHRGITHSLIAIPIWALLIAVLASLLFRVQAERKRLFRIALLTVSMHIFTDCLNPWGTGLFEPFSTYRVTFGVISYNDFVMLALLVLGVIATLLLRRMRWAHRISHWIWAAVILHVCIQAVMAGVIVAEERRAGYEQVMLAPNATPWQYNVVARSGDRFDISYGTVIERKQHASFLSEPITEEILSYSKRSELLHTWAHMLVLQQAGDTYRLFDPRFYRGGYSFLTVEFSKP